LNLLIARTIFIGYQQSTINHRLQMNLIQFSLRNPFAVMALSIGLCLLGAAVIPATPIDILPDFEKPVIVSFFSYPGLPTMDMEKSVSSRVERALTLAGRIEHQESRTVSGAAVIKVFFQPGTNPSSAMNDIVNLEASDMFHLPPGIEWPFTLRSEPANMPVVLAAISGEGISEKELYKIGYYAVRNRLGGLQGVQIPHPFGGKFSQMMIYVDPMKLRAYGLSARDVVQALRKANLVMAAGTVKIDDTELQIHPLNTLPHPEDIDDIVITVRDGKPIFIRDVGFAKDDAAIQYNIVRVNGKRSVYCPLLREPGENTIAVVDRIYEAIATEIPKLKALGQVNEAAEITLVNDQSSYIRNAMRNLLYQVGLGAVLVTLVVWVFLRRLLPTVAICGTIFLSILIGGLGFCMTGNTVNVMTLGGLALAIGTVVDAGIVVVENVMRHLDMGKSRLEAARDGAAEVATPVLAGTITTLAVFIPAIFLSGMIRYLFEPLSIAATLTIGSSYFIAMTVVPAFCARFVRQKVDSRELRVESDDEETSPTPDTALSTINNRPSTLYGRLLKSALAARHLVVAASIAVVVGSVLLLPGIGSELFPEVDAGTFELRLKTRPGTRLEETEKLVERIEATIGGEGGVIPKSEIDTIISNIGLPVGKGAGFSTILSSNSGPDTAYLIVNLKQSGRSTSTQQYVRRLREKLKADYPQEQFLFVNGSIVNMALNEGVPVPINVQVSAGSIEKCREVAEQLVEKLRPIRGATDVQIAQSLDYPQLDIQVDRVRAKYMGLDQEEVAQTILTSLGSSVGYSPTIWIDPKTGVDFFMGVQYENNEIQSLEQIHNIPLSLNTPKGTVTIPLSNIATVKRVNIPGEIAHYNIARVNDVYINVDGRDVGSVAADVEKALSEIEFENGVTVTMRGPVTTMKDGIQMLGLGLIVAAVLVYLVMLAQFKSWIDPLIIMLAVPLGLAGVLGMLFVTQTTINIQSLMGTLMMIGVVVNNSILLVEFANQLLSEGLSPREAAVKAAEIRLRPILMTSLTLVASMAPLSMHLAPGGEAMIPLARAVIGGMVASTVLTLFVVPCVYAMVKRPKAATEDA
jgi:HAE1 family hydrophobic/amphiphilic exporter-1